MEYFELSGLTYFVKPVLKKMLDHITQERQILQKSNKILLEFIENSKKRQKEFQIGDFFRLYLSNQSDSIGVMPLSTLGKEKGFNFINTYCDLDYYKNMYIDSIIIHIDKEFINSSMIEEKKLEDFINNIFITHLFDIYTSKLFTEFEYQENNETLSVFGLNYNMQRQWKHMKSSFEERNFFGVNLLSYFFKGLLNIIDTQPQIITINLSCKDKVLNIFLQEIIEYSIEPKKIQFVEEDDNPILKIKLYESNGKRIKNKDLDEDIFFKNLHNIDGREIQENDYTTINYNLNQELDYQYFKTDNWNTYVKIPIKMMLSLPINKEGEPDNNIYIPYMVDNDTKKNIDIITIGGAEHNRALAHLINKHRLQYKDKRIFGFLDNYFDLENKLKHIEDPEYKESFLMALNQEVAGYNAIFVARRNDENENSDAWEAKCIAFNLKENNHKQYNVVSIYGFSALASVYATHNLIANINDMNSINDNIFNPERQYFNEMKRDLREEYNTIEFKQKGLAILYRYKRKVSKDNINKVFHSKHALYEFLYNRENYIKIFTYNNAKDSIFDGEIEKGLRHYE